MAAPPSSLPAKCQADICIHPIGTNGPSISGYISKLETIFTQSGLDYKVHDSGTIIEGDWQEVTNVIGKAHAELHDQGVQRVHSDVRVITRTDQG